MSASLSTCWTRTVLGGDELSTRGSPLPLPRPATITFVGKLDREVPDSFDFIDEIERALTRIARGLVANR
jgi:hypothetical protein